MVAVMVEIRSTPTSPSAAHPPRHGTTVVAEPEPEGVELVDDMDRYLEHAMCSCNASDDNPY